MPTSTKESRAQYSPEPAWGNDWLDFFSKNHYLPTANCCPMLHTKTDRNKKASIRSQDSAPPISGYWPTSEPNAGDHDFPVTGSNFGNLTAFRAIFSHIFTAYAQERPLMNFRLKFWHHHSIPWSRFPYRARSAIRGRFLMIFALDTLNVRHISTSALVDLLTSKVCHVMRTSRWQFPPSLKLIRPSVASL